MPKRLPDEFFRSSPAQDGDAPAAHSVEAPTSRRRAPGTQRVARRLPRIHRNHGLTARILAAGMVVAFLVGLVIGQVIRSTPTVEPEEPTPTILVSEEPTSQGMSTTAPYDGPVIATQATEVTGRCYGGSGHDVPENLIDGNASSIWRCAGNGVDAQLRFRFPEGTRLVGLRVVNGNTVGEDRYLEERRILSVRWTFSDGSWLIQGFAADNPSAQEIRFPPVEVEGPVTLTVEASTSAGNPSPIFDAVSIASVEFLTNA